MGSLGILKTGIEIVAGIGVDTMITTAANAVMPKSFGLCGILQKVCVKAGSIGLSLVAGRAITKAIDEYLEEAKDIVEQAQAEMEEE
jgi:hypothetical protein